MLGKLVIAEVRENGQKLYLEKANKEAFDKLMVDYNKNLDFREVMIDSAFRSVDYQKNFDDRGVL